MRDDQHEKKSCLEPDILIGHDTNTVARYNAARHIISITF